MIWDKLRWPATIILLATLGAFVWLIDRERPVEELQWLIQAGFTLINLVITIYVGGIAHRAKGAAEATKDQLENGALVQAMETALRPSPPDRDLGTLRRKE